VSTELEDRLAAYRVRLDEAIARSMASTISAPPRSSKRAIAVAAATVIVGAGAAALAVAVDREADDPGTVGGTPSAAPTTQPATSPAAVSTLPDPGPSPNNGLLPRLMLESPVYVPVEIAELVDPNQPAARITYLRTLEDGAPQSVQVEVMVGAPFAAGIETDAVRGHPASEQPFGLPAPDTNFEDAASIGWQETPAVRAQVTVSPGTVQDAHAIAQQLQLGTDEAWELAIERIRTAPLPAAMQAWRDVRGVPAVSYGHGVG
jgi:hypothetical protein